MDSSHYGKFKVPKLPYKTAAGNASVAAAQYSMCIFLPNARDGLWSMVDELASSPGSLFDHLPKGRRSVRKLRLLKFKLPFFCCITEVLKSLGLQEAFGEKADLFDMVEENSCDVCLDDVFHKAVVEVNEEGTEAAACTAINGRRKQCARRPEEFVADHPFVFYTVEEVSGR